DPPAAEDAHVGVDLAVPQPGQAEGGERPQLGQELTRCLVLPQDLNAGLAFVGGGEDQREDTGENDRRCRDAQEHVLAPPERIAEVAERQRRSLRGGIGRYHSSSPVCWSRAIKASTETLTVPLR